MFLHHKLKPVIILRIEILKWRPFFSWLDPHASDGCKPRMSHSFLFPALLSLSLSLPPPPPWTISLYMYKISLFRYICCSGFMGFNFFRKLRCNIRCQFNCQHCKQVSGLSLVYLHLHHFLHRLQDSSMVFGAILHHVWSLW